MMRIETKYDKRQSVYACLLGNTVGPLRIEAIVITVDDCEQPGVSYQANEMWFDESDLFPSREEAEAELERRRGK